MKSLKTGAALGSIKECHDDRKGTVAFGVFERE